jgi:hypothetical protein
VKHIIPCSWLIQPTLWPTPLRTLALQESREELIADVDELKKKISGEK